MPPLKRWMRIVLQVISVTSVVAGLALALLRREIFELADLENPAVPFPIQAAGGLIALLGVGLGLAARRPYENRAFVPISAGANAFLVAAMAYNVASDKVPQYFAVVAVIQFILFVLLGTVARELYRASIDFSSADRSAPSRTPAFSPPRFARQAAWPISIAMVFLLALWSTSPALHDAYRWWNAPPRLVLTPAAAKLPSLASVVTPLRTVDAFAELKFNDPVDIVPLPDGSGRLLVAERLGRIQLIDNDPDAKEKTLFLDITDRVIDVRGSGEDGLSGIALHPKFADPTSPHRGEFFLHYTSMVAGVRAIRISKFRVPEGRTVADRTSEVVLIDQPDENPSHNGGSILFGPDGFLYVAIGDDDQRHPNPYAQYIDRDLFSGILRLDVDCQGGDISHAPPRQPNNGRTTGYYIPKDNPFVGMPGVLEEFYAIGLRNPWRASFDRETGKYWVTDVGERLREEVNIVTKGSNCGWAYVEGTVLLSSRDPNALGRPEPYLGTETWPVYEYQRDALNRCIIGGYVYRGSQFPELVGKYVYADTSGRIYALEVDENDKFVSNTLIAVIENGGHNAVSFGEDPEGELFLCIIKQLNRDTGEIHRLVRTERDPQHELATLLSETGLFDDLKTLKPASYLVPFEVNTPLWSDRAEKYRWIALPESRKITGDWDGTWTFPPGTVVVKHFDLPLDERDPAAADKLRRLETRVLVIDERGGIYGGTYRWNEDNSDARLIDHSETEEIAYVDAHGQKQSQSWLYPGRFECITCHNNRTPLVLAFNARQLNREITINGRSENQLVRFARAGMFANPWTEEQLERLPRLAPLDDETASVEHRVRSYLDANCAHCHRPHVYAGRWDGRFEVPLDHQQIIGGEAIFHKINDPLAAVVRPGDLEHSYMWLRMSSNVSYMRMPPLGRNVVDARATELVARWIESMEPPEVAHDIAERAPRSKEKIRK